MKNYIDLATLNHDVIDAIYQYHKGEPNFLLSDKALPETYLYASDLHTELKEVDFNNEQPFFIMEPLVKGRCHRFEHCYIHRNEYYRALSADGWKPEWVVENHVNLSRFSKGVREKVMLEFESRKVFYISCAEWDSELFTSDFNLSDLHYIADDSGYFRGANLNQQPRYQKNCWVTEDTFDEAMRGDSCNGRKYVDLLTCDKDIARQVCAYYSGERVFLLMNGSYTDRYLDTQLGIGATPNPCIVSEKGFADMSRNRITTRAYITREKYDKALSVYGATYNGLVDVRKEQVVNLPNQIKPEHYYGFSNDSLDNLRSITFAKLDHMTLVDDLRFPLTSADLLIDIFVDETGGKWKHCFILKGEYLAAAKKLALSNSETKKEPRNWLTEKQGE